MAKNFEIIFNREEPMLSADGTRKLWTEEDIVQIVEAHNCHWILVPHPADDRSSFLHYHLGIHTSSDNTYATIAKWFGLNANSVESIKKRFETTYALYVIHYNQEGKTPIDYHLAKNNFGLDYEKLINNVENKHVDDEVLDKLARGEMSEYQLYRDMSETWCRKHLKEIQNALIVRSKKFMVSDKEREMEVVYITGGARCGKSYLAKRFCKESNLTYYETSNGEHPFDDYMGQDAVILDDIRPSNFKFSELLKILDNHMSSKVSARYHNIDLNCKVMYMTTTLKMDDFYRSIQESDNEAVAQLKGRINTVFDVQKETIDMYVLSDDNSSYQKVVEKMPNPILSDKEIQLMTAEKRKELALQALKGIGDVTQYMTKQVQKMGSEDFEYLGDFGENPFGVNNEN